MCPSVLDVPGYGLQLLAAEGPRGSVPMLQPLQLGLCKNHQGIIANSSNCKLDIPQAVKTDFFWLAFKVEPKLPIV